MSDFRFWKNLPYFIVSYKEVCMSTYLDIIGEDDESAIFIYKIFSSVDNLKKLEWFGFPPENFIESVGNSSVANVLFMKYVIKEYGKIEYIKSYNNRKFVFYDNNIGGWIEHTKHGKIVLGDRDSMFLRDWYRKYADLDVVGKSLEEMDQLRIDLGKHLFDFRVAPTDSWTKQ